MTRTASIELVSGTTSHFDSTSAGRGHVDRDPAQWHQAVGVARQACARIFRDGGTAADAIRTFGLTTEDGRLVDWERAVTMVAASLCTRPLKRAA